MKQQVPFCWRKNAYDCSRVQSILEVLMKELVLYIHGKGGSAAESEHYRPLFPDCEVFGLDYQTFKQWKKWI